jgi:Helix-turn-helix domain
MTEFSDTTEVGSSHCQVLDIFNPRNHLGEGFAPKVALLKALFHIDNTGRLTKPPPPKSFSDQVFEYILSGKVPLPPARKARKATLVDGRVERGTSQQAMAILGLKPRKLQAMSASGEIPGAAKLGRQWTFDLTKLRRFVEQKEQATCQNEKPRLGATGAGKFSGVKLRLKGSASGGRLRQMIQQSQKRAAKQAKNAH